MTTLKRLREARTFRPRKDILNDELRSTLPKRVMDLKLSTGDSPQLTNQHITEKRPQGKSLPETWQPAVLKDHTNMRSGSVHSKPDMVKSSIVKPSIVGPSQLVHPSKITNGTNKDQNIKGDKAKKTNVKIPVSKVVKPYNMRFTPGFTKSKGLGRSIFHVQVPSRGIYDGDPDLLPVEQDDPSYSIRNLMTKLPKDVVDIDNDRTNIYHCPEYARDIYDYLQYVEMLTSFPDDYLEEGECNSHCRAVLIDWLIQVQVHLEMCQQTLHMAVTLVDRFLNTKNVSTNIVQLLGIACLLIASKFVERFTPEISILCRLTDNTYNKRQVLSMERTILKTLNFDLNIPDSTVFMGRFIRIEKNTTKEIENAAKYLLDMSLVSVQFVHYVPSLLTAAALYVSRKIFGVEKSWTAGMAYYTKYSEVDISDCGKNLAKMLIKAATSKHQGAREKYSSNRMFGAISLHPSLTEKSVLKKIAGETTV